jgi:hypothetical protein
MRNTILAGNDAPSAVDISGRITSSLGRNLIQDPSGASGFHPEDLLEMDPLLGPLGNYGGPTLTHELLEGSPAIDVGDSENPPDWDQRGEPYERVVGILDPKNPQIDIGAFEVQVGLAPGSGHGHRISGRDMLAPADILFALFLRKHRNHEGFGEHSLIAHPPQDR